MLKIIPGRTEQIETLDLDFEKRCMLDARTLLALEDALATRELPVIREELKALVQVAHRMRCTAPLFAQPDIGMLAASLEDLVIKTLALEDRSRAGASLARVRDLLRKLYIALGCVWLRFRGHSPSARR